MNTLNSLFILATILLIILAFGLGIFSLYRNPKSRVVQLWFLKCLTTGIWSVGFLFMLISSTEREGIISSHLLHLGAAFIPIFFCHFILVLIYKDKQKNALLITGYALAVIFAVLSFTKFIVAGASAKFGFSYWIDAGSLYPLLLVYFWFYAFVGLYFLLAAYLKSDGIMKRRITFILLASVIGFGGGGTNFLPQALGIYPFGQFFTWLYPILITYGILVDEFKVKF